MTNTEALIALNMIEHVGPVRVRQLLEYFKDAPAILAASRAKLMQVHGIGVDVAEAIATWESVVDLTGELQRIKDFGCHVLTQSDEQYPELLRQIYDPPLVLYVKGQLTAKDKNAVAMVGSRQTTHYGIETARKLAYQLGYIGVTVVSGGARGIDTAAHQGALSGKGRTVAVLGTGINLVFPPENADLFERIAASGAIITQFPFNRPAAPNETGVLPAIELSENEQKVFATLDHEEVVIDDIIRKSSLPSSAVSVALLSLEMKRLVKQLPGKVFVRNT